MADDPYKTLGVKNDASQEDIRKAYRQRAKKLHPDLNPGDRQAEERFKDVTAAYDLLSDAEKRARFDNGEIDASGSARPERRYYRDFAENPAGNAYASDAGFADFSGFTDADDIMSAFFDRAGQRNRSRRGADVRYELDIDFLDAVNGAKRAITLPDGSTLDIRIPAGTRDGQTLRLRGKGQPALGQGAAGDALITVHVLPHPLFRREGDDIHVELPISVREAVLGGKLRVPAPTGTVTMTVPKWSNTGTKLRLRGKGVRRPDGSRGDEVVTLRIELPENPDPELERCLARSQTRERTTQQAET